MKQYPRKLHIINGVGLAIMSNNICVICGTKFESDRVSKLACSENCERIRKSNYDRDYYIKFRNANRKNRRKMLVEKYSISSSNLHQFDHVCDGCLTKFYYDYVIFENFTNTYVTSFNTTPWGAACCPNCGLVEEQEMDKEEKIAMPMNEVDKKIYITKLHKSKMPTIKKEAIHFRNGIIDFISEAESVRSKIRRIFDKKILSQEEIDLCIKTLFIAFKNSSKDINTKKT